VSRVTYLFSFVLINVTKVMTRTKENGEVSLNREDNVSLQCCQMHEASVGSVGVKYGILKWCCRRFRCNHKQTSDRQWWRYQVKNQYLFSLNLQDLCCLHEIVVFLLSARDKKEPIISVAYSVPGKCIR
jgi:hypothetical protein